MVETRYTAILEIFETYGQERSSRNRNTPESWFRLLTGPVRYEFTLKYKQSFVLFTPFQLNRSVIFIVRLF